MPTFGERLRELRKAKEITQIELAKVLSLANSTISQYEANRRDPDSSTLQRLADYFGVSLDYLLGRSDIRNRAENNFYIYVEKQVPQTQYNCTLPEPDNQGARVRKARLAKNLTIRALAKITGLAPETISYIESGQNKASLSTLRVLSKTLGVSICYLGCFESLPEDTLGQKIRKGRFCAGLTIEELAKTIGVDPGTLRKWEQDKYKPLKKHLEKLKQHIKI